MKTNNKFNSIFNKVRKIFHEEMLAFVMMDASMRGDYQLVNFVSKELF